MVPKTREGIESSREFRVILNALRRSFPFVKSIRLTDNWEEYSSTLFLECEIDIDKFFEYLGGNRRLPLYLKYVLYKDSPDSDIKGTLSTFGLNLEESMKINELMHRKVKVVHSSDSILPEEEKIPFYAINISSYYITKDDLMKYLKSHGV
jgi:hypothetical protein